RSRASPSRHAPRSLASLRAVGLVDRGKRRLASGELERRERELRPRPEVPFPRGLEGFGADDLALPDERYQQRSLAVLATGLRRAVRHHLGGGDAVLVQGTDRPLAALLRGLAHRS